jgi:hypothetical protein
MKKRCIAALFAACALSLAAQSGGAADPYRSSIPGLIEHGRRAFGSFGYKIIFHGF